MLCVFFLTPSPPLPHEKPRAGGAEHSEVFMIGESPRGCPPVMICQPFEEGEAQAKEFTSFTVCIKFKQRLEAEKTFTGQRG